MAEVADAICKARRTQSIVDILVPVVLVMFVWPFPVARVMLTPLMHIAGVLAACVVAELAYYVVCAVAWRQTVGMRLVGTRLGSAGEGSLTCAQAAGWGLVSGATASWYAVAPRSAYSASVAERVSRTRVLSTE